MRNIPIVGKFLLIIGAFGIFSLCTALYSGMSMSEIDDGYIGMSNGSQKAALSLSRANRSIQESRAAIGDLLIATSEDGAANAIKELTENRGGFETFMDAAIAARPNEPGLLALKAKGIEALDGTCGPAIEAGKNAKTIEDNASAQAFFLRQCQPVLAALAPEVTQITADMVGIANHELETLTATTETTVQLTVGAVLLGIAVVIALGYFAVRAWLVRPISELAKVMGEVANGDLSATIVGTDRRDEIGSMAAAVQVFKENGLRARMLEEQTESMRSDAERARIADQERIAREAEQLKFATSSLGESLSRLAAGDLTCQISTAFAPDYESLRHDFNASVDQLALTVGSIMTAIDNMESGTHEIAAGTNDLSRRTEQQAAALEETAAALDQITVNVTGASKLTAQVRSVAESANQSAVKSAEVVGHTEDAMQRIEGSSQQISNIIGVIDEIAFQTNLLALNAGVEAARAGEAGKGFAVVAQEVRELAQRSAQAAKEIKGLIHNSTAEVTNGVNLVRDASAALKTIGDYISEINTHMRSIATSAEEQSSGLTQINSAVNHMDQSTQQNAAMVEQSTAAASSLSQEATRLKELVSRFRIGNSSIGHRRAA